MKANELRVVAVFVSVLLATSCLESNPQPAPSTTGTVDRVGGGPPNKGGGEADEEEPNQAAADVSVDSGLPAGLDNGAADCSGEQALDVGAEAAGWCDVSAPGDSFETSSLDADPVDETTDGASQAAPDDAVASDAPILIWQEDSYNQE